jgi:hypothetical protein
MPRAFSFAAGPTILAGRNPARTAQNREADGFSPMRQQRLVVDSRIE